LNNYNAGNFTTFSTLTRCRNIRRTHKRGQALSVTSISFTFPVTHYYYRFLSVGGISTFPQILICHSFFLLLDYFSCFLFLIFSLVNKTRTKLLIYHYTNINTHRKIRITLIINCFKYFKSSYIRKFIITSIKFIQNIF